MLRPSGARGGRLRSPLVRVSVLRSVARWPGLTTVAIKKVHSTPPAYTRYFPEYVLAVPGASFLLKPGTIRQVTPQCSEIWLGLHYIDRLISTYLPPV